MAGWKMKAVLALLLAVGVVAAGTGALVRLTAVEPGSEKRGRPGAAFPLGVRPKEEQPLRLDRFGDPLPRIAFRDAPVSRELRAPTEERIRGVFAGLARAGGGRVLRTSVDDVQDHPGGGCRMGDDPAGSVVDPWGRSHDHENLFVVGAPTMVSGGCSNGTLTFAALSLRSAAEIGRAYPVRG